MIGLNKNKYLVVATFCLLIGFLTVMSSIGRCETLGFSIAQGTTNNGSLESMIVTVIDDVSFAPIPDAKVVVADSLDPANSSQEEMGSSNSDGVVQFTGLNGKPKAVTVTKSGFEVLSVVGVAAQGIIIYLKPLLIPDRSVVVKGLFGGFNPHPGKKFLQAGLVTKSMGLMEMLDFQVSSFFSPLKDTIDVYGQREIPSNLVLPDQEISVLFGTVRLNKPEFRLPLLVQRPARLVGVQGVGKVSDLMSGLGGGGNSDSSAELLNKLSFQRLGFTEMFSPSPSLRKDFNAGLALVPNRYQVSINRPPFAANVIVSAILDLEADRQVFAPSDVKTAVTAEDPTNIKTVNLAGLAQPLPGAVLDIFTIAVAKKDKRVSGIFTDQAPAKVAPGEFLGVDEIPDFPSMPVSISARASVRGLGMVSFHATTPRIDSDGDDNPTAKPLFPLEKRKEIFYPVWVVYVLPGAGEVTIPTKSIPSDAVVGKYSISQLEFGAAFDEHSLDGRQILRHLERFSKATAFAAK